jgi:hypothetical protein
MNCFFRCMLIYECSINDKEICLILVTEMIIIITMVSRLRSSLVNVITIVLFGFLFLLIDQSRFFSILKLKQDAFQQKKKILV